MRGLKWVVLVLAFLIVPHFWPVGIVREVVSGVGAFLAGVLLAGPIKAGWKRL